MPTTLHLSLAEYDSMVSVGAFDRFPRKVELIRGELIQMNPAGPLHDHLITYLTNWSVRNSNPKQTQITSQTGLSLPGQVSRSEPDLMWLRLASFRDHHPMASDVQLAIEVAYSSLAYDLEEKRLLYAEAGIAENWIVDAEANCIHVLTHPEQSDYTKRQVFKVGEIITPSFAPNAMLSLQDLFEG